MCYIAGVLDLSAEHYELFEVRLSAFGNSKDTNSHENEEIELDIAGLADRFIVKVTPHEGRLHALSIGWVGGIRPIEVVHVLAGIAGHLKVTNGGDWQLGLSEVSARIIAAYGAAQQALRAAYERNAVNERIDILDGAALVSVGSILPLCDLTGENPEFGQLELPSWYEWLSKKPTSTFLAGVLKVREMVPANARLEIKPQAAMALQNQTLVSLMNHNALTFG